MNAKTFVFPRRLGLVGAMLALVALATSLVACKKDAESPLPPRGVVAHEVRVESKGGGHSYAAEVRPRVEAALGFRIGGKLVERKVELGDTVRAGQVLARLDGADPALVARAAASQQAAAAADFDLASAEATRFEGLRAQGFVSQSALDSRIAARKAAENRLAAARAQADVANNQSAYADLVADGPGVVSAVLAEPGQVLAAGAPVVRLARQGGQDKDALISVAENQVALFKPGREVRIVLWANGERVFRGRVREIAPQADPVTRTFAVRIGFVDADTDVRLGMTATVLLGIEVAGVVRLPSPSVVQQDGKPAVWVIGEGGAVSLRPVTVAAFREDGVIVSGGVKVGEKIIAAGGQKIMPGERIRVLETR